MLQISTSTADEINPEFVRLAAGRGGNRAWLAQALEHEALQGRDDTLVLLIGSSDLTGFRLRVAQSHARADLVSSDWSHVALLERPTDLGAAEVLEVSLTPRGGFGWPPATNGVRRGRLKNYFSRRRHPNLALVRIPVPWERLTYQLELFSRERRTLDVNELTLAWLAFVWGVRDAPNPLLQGLGIPSAAMVEAVVGAAGYELTPGIDSAASCPEAIWQTCRWWHLYFGDEVMPAPPRGCWIRRQSIEDGLGFTR